MNQKYTMPISLQRLLAVFTQEEHSFVCYAAERIVTDEACSGTLGYIDSVYFWNELHRLDPGLFLDPHTPDADHYAAMEQWINPDCFDKFQFIKAHLTTQKHSGTVRNFRKQLLALLVERHGPDTELTFRFTKA